MCRAMTVKPEKAARNEMTVGHPAPGAVEPRVNTDEPDSRRALPKVPSSHGHTSRAKPSTSNDSHTSSSATRATGPDTASTRSLAS